MKFINDFNFNSVHEIYMSGFSNISAILNLYRRFFKYIDLPTNSDKTKRAHSLKSRPSSNHLFAENRSSCVNPGSKFISPLWRTYTVLSPSNLGGFPGL